MTSDRAPVYPRVRDELVAGARHVVEQYANNVVEADHGKLNARLRPMCGLKRLHQHGPSPQVTRLCRTYAAATATSSLKSPSLTVCA